MDLLCRNPACVYHARPIDVVVNHNQCPHCKWPLLGESYSTEAVPPSSLPGAEILNAKNGGQASKAHHPTPTPGSDDSKAAGKLKGLFGRVTRIKVPEETPTTPAGKAQDPPISSPSERVADPSRPRKKKPRPESDPKPAQSPPPTHVPESVMAGKATLAPIIRQPGIAYKPQYVLERVFPDRVEALDFVEMDRKTPLIYEDPTAGPRDVAYVKNTTTGLVLTPKDPSIGVFVRIKSPRRLVTGTRFRIGNYVIEARLPDRSENPAKPEPPEFRELESQGELIFLRVDGTAGLSFPLLRKVLIGRGQPGEEPVDLPLLDPSVSRVHASITPVEGGLKLKDLKSTHGTFIEVREPSYLDEGDSFRIGEILLRIVSYPRSTI